MAPKSGPLYGPQKGVHRWVAGGILGSLERGQIGCKVKNPISVSTPHALSLMTFLATSLRCTNLPISIPQRNLDDFNHFRSFQLFGGGNLLSTNTSPSWSMVSVLFSNLPIGWCDAFVHIFFLHPAIALYSTLDFLAALDAMRPQTVECSMLNPSRLKGTSSTHNADCYAMV
jgi:hypothetical protein